MDTSPENILPSDHAAASLVGRVWNPDAAGPSLICVRDGTVLDITSADAPTMRDLLEMDDPAAFVRGRPGASLGKAKDNNASSAIGPFIRLFDDRYGIDDVRRAELVLEVTGEDGFELRGRSAMSQISRDPRDLVAQTCGAHHQYPDGFCLYLGTLFAPVQDRRAPGACFNHEIGDEVRITKPRPGTLQNRVSLSPDCPAWCFGTSALMRNLAGRGLI